MPLGAARAAAPHANGITASRSGRVQSVSPSDRRPLLEQQRCCWNGNVAAAKAATSRPLAASRRRQQTRQTRRSERHGNQPHMQPLLRQPPGAAHRILPHFTPRCGRATPMPKRARPIKPPESRCRSTGAVAAVRKPMPAHKNGAPTTQGRRAACADIVTIVRRSQIIRAGRQRRQAHRHTSIQDHQLAQTPTAQRTRLPASTSRSKRSAPSTGKLPPQQPGGRNRRQARRRRAPAAMPDPYPTAGAPPPATCAS